MRIGLDVVLLDAVCCRRVNCLDWFACSRGAFDFGLLSMTGGMRGGFGPKSKRGPWARRRTRWAGAGASWDPKWRASGTTPMKDARMR